MGIIKPTDYKAVIPNISSFIDIYVKLKLYRSIIEHTEIDFFNIC